MPIRFSPGCCCGCTLISDSFDRADSSTVSGWTEDAGDWEIASNKVQVASTSALLSRSNAATYDSVGVSVKLQSSADGDILRVYLTQTTYVQLVVGASATIALYRESATDGTCSVTALHAVEHTIEIISCENSVIVVWLNGELVVFDEDPITLPGSPVVGLGTGGTLTGTAKFDDFVLTEYDGSPSTNNGCDECEYCEYPDMGTADQLKLILSGFSGAECENVDGTYYLDPVECPSTYADTCFNSQTLSSLCLCYELDVEIDYGDPEGFSYGVIDKIFAFYGVDSFGTKKVFVLFLDTDLTAGSQAVFYFDITLSSQTCAPLSLTYNSCLGVDPCNPGTATLEGVFAA